MILHLIIILIRLSISYIRYALLTVVVILLLTPIIFILLIINPNFSFEFLRYFAFLNPEYKTGSYSMGKKEIMEIFSVISFILWISVSVIKLLINKFFGLSFSSHTKLKKFLLFFTFNIVYLGSIITVGISDTIENAGIFVFLLFYFIELFAIIAYLVLCSLSQSLYKLQRNTAFTVD